MPLDLITAICAAVPGQNPTGAEASSLSPAESLTVAITMEGLLFAAFSVGYKLTEETEEGRSPFFTQAWFGWCIVGVILVLAVAACASWWEIFGSDWPSNIGQLLLGLGLALGIIAQPIFAAVINVESKKT
jgi:hypothetical protein